MSIEFHVHVAVHLLHWHRSIPDRLQGKLLPFLQCAHIIRISHLRFPNILLSKVHLMIRSHLRSIFLIDNIRNKLLSLNFLLLRIGTQLRFKFSQIDLLVIIFVKNSQQQSGQLIVNIDFQLFEHSDQFINVHATVSISIKC